MIATYDNGVVQLSKTSRREIVTTDSAIARLSAKDQKTR